VAGNQRDVLGSVEGEWQERDPLRSKDQVYEICTTYSRPSKVLAGRSSLDRAALNNWLEGRQCHALVCEDGRVDRPLSVSLSKWRGMSRTGEKSEGSA
jgi:hypothetical protein